MQTLTRDQAIKRIRDIINRKQVHHITWAEFEGCYLRNAPERGAINELMAIFDIKEEEL